MLTRSDLETLAGYESQTPVVSLYLYLDPRLRSNAPEAYQAEVKTLLKKIDSDAPQALIDTLDTFFGAEFDWLGQSLVLFAESDRSLWHVEQLDVPLPSTIHLGRKPYITPLTNLLNTYGDYSLILIEQQAVRLIHFRFGVLVEDESVEGEDVKRLKAGGGISGPGGAAHRGGSDLSAHNREVVNRNIRNFVDATVRFCTRHNSPHLILSGTDTTVAQFEGALPQAWQDRVIGHLSLATQAPENDIRRQTLEAMEAYQKQHEYMLVDQITMETTRRGAGAAGTEPVLEAIHAGRVQTLALAEDFHLPGFRCPTCGYMTTVPRDVCPYSSDDLIEVTDIVEHAIRRVIVHGGDVAIISDDDRLDSMGALLRY